MQGPTMRSASALVKRDLRQKVTDSITALEKGVDPCVALTGTGACHSAIHHRPLPAVGTLALSGVALNPDFSARPSACQSPRIAPPVCAGRETTPSISIVAVSGEYDSRSEAATN